VPHVFYQHISALEPVVFTLFEQMYDPKAVYICDRFFSVSSRVYAKLHGRGYELSDAWVMPDLHVIRLECEVDTLRSRRSGETQLNQLHRLYRDVCRRLACASYHVISSDHSMHRTVAQVASVIRGLTKDVDGEGGTVRHHMRARHTSQRSARPSNGTLLWNMCRQEATPLASRLSE
jgi:hypothetical protein